MGQTNNNHSWMRTLRAYRHPRVITMLFLGFSAGLPLLLIFSSLSLWLREAGVDRSTVTYFSWAALGYSFKFIWAPIVDKLPLPLLSSWLGRRRAWLLLAQLSIILAILWMAFTDPAQALMPMIFAAVMLGFSSATQDIVIDAYRIESAGEELQALMSSSYITGYRMGMLVSGAGTLKLAAWFTSGQGYDYLAWQWAYLWMAAAMTVGLLTTLLIAEPITENRESRYLNSLDDYLRFLALFGVTVCGFIWVFVGIGWLVDSLNLDVGVMGAFMIAAARLVVAIGGAWVVAWLAIHIGLARRVVFQETYIEPLADFFKRYGKTALLLLALIGLYRISDIVLGAISNVFYQDMGFTKHQIADITKTFGLIMTIVGAFLGGGLSLRYGVMRILFLGAFLSAATNLLFLLLANSGSDVSLLILVIAVDNLSAGLASAAFIAYLSSLTNISFTAFQYALFSSLMTLLPKLLGGYSGSIVDTMGYSNFFMLTALIGLPVMLLVWLAGKKLSI